MKASDICVGDWLNIYTFPNDNQQKKDLFPAQVTAVSVFDPFKEPDDVTVELVIEQTKGIASRPLDTCLPIELTEEILVRNGFERHPLWHHCTLEVGDGSKIYIPLACGGGIEYVSIYKHFEELTTRDIDIQIPIHYVHQLQHLLRLCGIDKEIEL